MRLPLTSELALSLCLLVAGAGAAAGQTTVAASYDPILHELTENSWLGGHADVASFWGPIAAVGEVGANHFDQATVMTLAPGGRYAIASSSNSKIQLSAQALLGWWHCSACEVDELFLQPGVLVDWARNDSMKIRFQFDVRRIFFDFGGETAERVGVGVVWTLK
jgi:hypothetical protein